jgi:hypothetical protein
MQGIRLALTHVYGFVKKWTEYLLAGLLALSMVGGAYAVIFL